MINPEFISKIINNLDTSKTTQQVDIPTKIIKDIKDLFSYFISESFKNAVNKSVFSDELKMQISNQSIKRNQETKKKIICMNVVCMIKLKITLIRYCQNISANLEKGLVHNITYYP